jgi:aldehyde:ferredoxin oxidoreductase
MDKVGRRLLKIKLGQNQVELGLLPTRYYDHYLGGSNLGARLLLESRAYLHPPLSPRNPFLILSGPITGLNFPGTGRLHLMARSPQTGLVGEASIGGWAGLALRAAGIGCVMITGKADRPGYLLIKYPSLESGFVPAPGLWGLDTYQTEQRLIESFDRRHTEVLAIGPAGENLVPLSAVVHRRHNVAARTGLGAVLGSKNIKAIVIQGSGKQQPDDPDQFKALQRECLTELGEHYWSQRRKEFGTVGSLEWAVETGRAPTKNWQDIDWLEEVKEITGETLKEKFGAGGYTCYGCPLLCKREVRVDEGPIQVEEGPGPEYESAVSLGAMLLNKDLAGLLKANETCNRMGLDTISVGATLAWAVEAKDRGDLPAVYQDDSDLLGWGESAGLIEMVEKIAFREGRLAELLGRGSRYAAKVIGGGSSQYAIQVKGLELGYHHPRAARGMEITYATNPRGAVHMEFPFVFGFEEAGYGEWIQQIITSSDQSTLPNALTVCAHISNAMGVEFFARLLTAATGDVWDVDQLTLAGTRGWYLKRMFNALCGAGLDEDRLPQRVIDQMLEHEVDHPDFEHALALYHQARELRRDGWPAKSRLQELQLDEFSGLAGQYLGRLL